MKNKRRIVRIKKGQYIFAQHTLKQTNAGWTVSRTRMGGVPEEAGPFSEQQATDRLEASVEADKADQWSVVSDTEDTY